MGAPPGKGGGSLAAPAGGGTPGRAKPGNGGGSALPPTPGKGGGKPGALEPGAGCREVAVAPPAFNRAISCFNSSISADFVDSIFFFRVSTFVFSFFKLLP